MLGFLEYTLESGIVFAVLTLIYRYVYRGDSYNRWERGYILGSTALSYLLPLLKVRFYTQPRITRPYDSIVDIISRGPVDVVTLSHERTFTGGFDRFVHSQLFDNIIAVLFAVYIAGLAVKLVSYINGIRKTLRLRRGEYKLLDGGIRMYITGIDTVAFSFFRNIFLGRRAAQLSRDEMRVVVAHETNHIRGLHSLDTLVFGLFSALQWMNPMVRVAMRESRAVCESIADSNIDSQGGITEYSRLILRLGIQGREASPQPRRSSGTLLRRIAQLLSTDGERIRRIRFICTLPVLALTIAAYLILGGMANPISAGLRVPVDGKYSVTAGYFEDQRIMDSNGMLYSVSHRQMDIKADTSALILAPADCIVDDVQDREVSISCGDMLITIGGIAAEPLQAGDMLTKGQAIGRPLAGNLMFLKVWACGEPINPELIFDF